MSSAIELVGVSKKFKIFDRPIDRLKEFFSFGKKKYHEDFQALSDINLSIAKGKTVGIIGVNGAGKSTLLQVIAGILTPSSGIVKTHGRVATLLELGSGFDPEFTGRENIFINGAIMGIGYKEMKKYANKIIDFAQIGNFIDHPVKIYSTGMYLRLAFSIAMCVMPDVLIIDEVLTVGDVAFQHKCLEEVSKMKKKGATIVFISHNSALIKSICDEVCLLDRGAVLDYGQPEHIVDKYHSLYVNGSTKTQQNYLFEKNHRSILENESPFDSSTKGIKILALEVIDKESGSTQKFFSHKSIAVAKVRVRFLCDVERPNIGIIVRDGNGYNLFGTTTKNTYGVIPRAEKNTVLTVEFEIELALANGFYSLIVKVWDDKTLDSPELLARFYEECAFEVINAEGMLGPVSLRSSVRVKPASLVAVAREDE